MNEGTLAAGGTAIVTAIIVVVSLAAAIIPLVLVLKKLGGLSAANARLLATGIPTTARILRVGATGLTVNDAPQLEVMLEVQPPEGPGYRGGSGPFTASSSIFVPIFAMARIVPGATVPVRFDPAAPANVAVDFRAMGYA
jgi:hypothetical protein